jgi:hypothetical protein
MLPIFSGRKKKPRSQWTAALAFDLTQLPRSDARGGRCDEEFLHGFTVSLHIYTILSLSIFVKPKVPYQKHEKCLFVLDFAYFIDNQGKSRL